MSAPARGGRASAGPRRSARTGRPSGPGPVDGVGTDVVGLQAAVRRVRARPVEAPRQAAQALARLVIETGGSPRRLWPLLDYHGGIPRALRSPHAVRPDARPGGRLPASAHDPGIIPYWDARYPAGLWRLVDPPPLLFYRGNAALLARPALAVVGTRRCSDHGRRAAHAIAVAAGSRGAVVVSGHAQGIDAAAHEGAVEHGTIAVLGCGIDVPYPRALGPLRRRIESRGLLLSEFPPGTPPLPHHFPRRNRLIAALSGALVVVEAPHRSGAQNTVTHALDLGLEVGAVPGAIDRPSCAGSNRLLREGAAVICEPADALALLGLRGAAAPADNESGAAPLGTGAWTALAGAGATLDELADRSGRSPAELAAALSELELAGIVGRAPGGRYVRRGSGTEARPTVSRPSAQPG
jgi:DNA processing protein